MCWSANAACIIVDYIERSRYPLCTITTIQHNGSGMPAYLDCALNTPSFLRYRKAALVSTGDMKNHMQLLCPVPPLDVQKKIVEITRRASCDDFRKNMEARLASQLAKNEVERLLGIEEICRSRFGPLYIRPRQNTLSWSAHKTLSFHEYICTMPLYNLKDMLKTEKKHSINSELDYVTVKEDNVLCVRPNYVGYGGLIESPNVVQREQIKVDGSQFVPVGGVLFYRIHPDRMHYWINRGEFNLPVYAISKDFFVCRPNENVIVLDFLDLLMHLSFIANQFKGRAYGHIPRISVSSLLVINFPIPRLDVQKDLASRFLRTVRGPDELALQIKEQKKVAIELVEKELFYDVK